MKKDPRIFLAHILERIEKILEYTKDGRDAFFANTMMQDAVIRNLEVTGEAAKRIPEDFRKTQPAVPWRSLAALRDVLIHQYEGVSLPEVWQVVETHLPTLKISIRAVLPPLDQLEREIADDQPSS